MARKKTLKGRIGKVILFSILISVLLFVAVMSFIAASSERDQGYLLATMLSNLMSNQVFGPDRVKASDSDLFIPPINLETDVSKQLKDFENEELNHYILKSDAGISLIFPDSVDASTFNLAKDYRYHDLTDGRITIGQIAQFKITLLDKEIYKSEHYGQSVYLSQSRKAFLYPLVHFMERYFDIESVFHMMIPGIQLPAGENQSFATITVRLDPGFMVSYYGFFLLGILASAGITLLVGILLASSLSKLLSKPFKVLESRLLALAGEDYETTLQSQIVVKKRQLREISSISTSTNTIIQKMHQFNSMQVDQKKQLENQKTELEAQKDELLESRHKINEAQSQLIQSQNLASIGQLTAAISHEIDSPLEVIASNVEKQNSKIESLLANGSIQNNPELKEFILQLKEAGNLNQTAFKRIDSIIKSLSNFSKLDQTEMELTDINESLKSVVLLTSNLWKRRIIMHEEYGTIPQIKGFSGLINQVFMNLIVNAIHAIPDKGDIYLKTWHQDNMILVSVKDTGTGIEEAIMPHIFETGFTTKKQGSGSGLGLSISKSIITKHHGKIDVKSKPSEGAEFIVTFPV